MLETSVSNLLPNEPEGCDIAKSSDVKLFKEISETAIASPITRVVVVLEVGAKLLGHASLSTLMSK
jgi:hypothetical protein